MFLSFDVLTALTVSGILGIILLYVLVVYRKGWLRNDLRSSESYLLCPNEKCRRVFKDPILLTDLSKTPPESYQACPHCSTDLQLSPSFMEEKLNTRPGSAPKNSPIIEDAKSNVKTNPAQDGNKAENKGNRILQGIIKHAPKNDTPNKNVKDAGIDSPKQGALESTKFNQPRNHTEKPFSERPRTCPHHFGYVKTLPKNTSIPDECLWCPWIVDCLAGKHKIEA